MENAKPVSSTLKDFLTPGNLKHLQELAAERKSIHCDECHLKNLLNKAVDYHRRSEYFKKLNESYRQLAEDPESLEAYRQEIALFDQTVGDGLENEPPYYGAQ